MSNNGKVWKLVCARCEKPFETWHKKKYCSVECRLIVSRANSKEWMEKNKDYVRKQRGHRTREEWKAEVYNSEEWKAREIRYREYARKELTLQVVGDLEGISRERARQLMNVMGIERKKNVKRNIYGKD